MKTLSRFGWMEQELTELKAKNLYRAFRTLEQVTATSAIADGRPLTLFCGNDYLGLSHHTKLVEALKRAAESDGVGSGSARLIAGTSAWHSALEARIAAFLEKERALVFSSGYLANLGALSALAKANDLVILDKLSHASLIDAARLSRATVRVFPHRNLDYLERVLRRTHRGKVWIATDSVFSMDGDLAPLPELVELKNRYGAYLVVDEAHATGVFGPHGRGVSERFGVMDEIDVHIGTCSKAIGALGGFVAGRSELIEYLVNHARTFIFDTALPPSICAASLAAFDLIEQEPSLRKQLWRNVERLRSNLRRLGAPVLEGEGPIIGVVIGEEKRTLQAAESLFRHGFLIPAVRFPTVPRGKARLRVTVSAAHSESEIDWLLSAFKTVLHT